MKFTVAIDLQRLFSEDSAKPREDMFCLIIMAWRVNVGQTEKCIAVYPFGHSFNRNAIGRVDIFCIVMKFKLFWDAGGFESAGNHVEVAVESAFGANHIARGKGCDNVGEVEFNEEFRDEVGDVVRPRATSVLVGEGHDKSTFASGAEKVVIYKGVDVGVHQADSH